MRSASSSAAPTPLSPAAGRSRFAAFRSTASSGAARRSGSTRPDRFAAIVSRIHILPIEGVREDLKDALPSLQQSAIADRMNDLASQLKAIPPVAGRTFALTGARLIDGTGRAPIDDAVVIVRDGRIAAAGPRASTPVPAGVRDDRRHRSRSSRQACGTCTRMRRRSSGCPHILPPASRPSATWAARQPFLTAMRDTVASGKGLGATRVAGRPR